jgi:hypothetical protein
MNIERFRFQSWVKYCGDTLYLNWQIPHIEESPLHAALNCQIVTHDYIILMLQVCFITWNILSFLHMINTFSCLYPGSKYMSVSPSFII